jgi:predicted secreted protein
MTIPAGLVLFAVIWFMVLFVVLPLRLKSQGETGEVVPGTPSSAPERIELGRKVLIVTAVSVVLFVPLAWIIASGVVTIRDIDFFGRMGPE